MPSAYLRLDPRRVRARCVPLGDRSLNNLYNHHWSVFKIPPSHRHQPHLIVTIGSQRGLHKPGDARGGIGRGALRCALRLCAAVLPSLAGLRLEPPHERQVREEVLRRHPLPRRRAVCAGCAYSGVVSGANRSVWGAPRPRRRRRRRRRRPQQTPNPGEGARGIAGDRIPAALVLRSGHRFIIETAATEIIAVTAAAVIAATSTMTTTPATTAAAPIAPVRLRWRLRWKPGGGALGYLEALKKDSLRKG